MHRTRERRKLTVKSLTGFPGSIHFVRCIISLIQGDNAWQLKQRNRDTSQAGHSKRGVSSHQMSGSPGDKPFLWACNTYSPCLGLPSWPLSSWASTQTPPFSSPASALSSSSSSSVAAYPATL